MRHALRIGAAELLLLGTARPCRRRSAVALVPRALRRAGQRRAAQGGRGRAGGAGRAGRRTAGHAALALDRLARRLWPGGARHRRAPTARGAARPHACARGATGRRRGEMLPTGRSAARRRRGSPSCPASPRAPSGCRTPPPRCRPGCWRCGRASASPISAPRRAARPLQLAAAGAAGHGGRARPAAAGAAAREPGAAGLPADLVSRCGQWVAGAHLRRRPAGCALHRHRHHPPPSRHALPEARRRTSPPWPSAGACWRAPPSC